MNKMPRLKLWKEDKAANYCRALPQAGIDDVLKKGYSMDFRIFSTQLLENKRRMEVALLNITDELAMLEEAKTSVATGCCNSAPTTGGGGNRYEERLVKLIDLCDELRARKKNIELNLACIKRAFTALNDYEQDLLNSFYVYGGKGVAERVMSRYHKERSTVYRDKDKALAIFTQALYGVSA
ncbi:MAG: hypothetical protein IJB65_03520 [Clostridia bacterium]|nr:hypothetical protein [Clostridia bacterium]